MSPPLYGLDIETDTSVDGLDPSVSPIVAVAVATPDGDRVFQGAEDLVLHRTDELMSELDPGIVVTWNGSGFDLPFLAERAQRLGVTLGLDLWDDGPERTEPGVVRGRWYAHDHLDGQRLALDGDGEL
ncbi:MAG TPA: 3'-5' exonuclease, partial [Microthrixaceae bacterium]|nr:3'-5' exonuclease [Microthrixaceae bacterium]